MRHRLAVASLLVALVVPVPSAVLAEEPVDLDMITRIRDEGFRRSEVKEMLSVLTDQIGSRLTGSPGMMEANEWTKARMAKWGLDARLEEWGPFGRGWSFSRAAVHMTAPHTFPLIALPKAWTPGTDGEVEGEVVRIDFSTEEDLDEHRGKLEGKIVLLDEPRDLEPKDEALFDRYDESELADIHEYGIPGRRSGRGGRGGSDPDARRRMMSRFRLRRVLNDYLTEEGVLATISVSRFDGTIVLVGGGGSREKDENPGPPSLSMAAEHYNWLCRLLDAKKEVRMSVDVEARFHDENPMAYNTVADLPGTDRKDEVVMLGGHLDSWHGATGATDNAACCAVVMEALRILQALEVKPRRTIRAALWSGEEQGLLGSRGYVSQHFARRQEPEKSEGEGEGEEEVPSFMRRSQGPLEILEDHANLSAYFNLDNGAGKIRGIYCEENAAVRPIFEAWLQPFADIGANTVTLRQTGGTDHQSFDRVGLPGFQFIQDRLDYFTRTHHTNLDVSDLCPEDDLKQAAVILASFVYHAAMRDEKLPRKPMPREEPPREPRGGGPPVAESP